MIQTRESTSPSPSLITHRASGPAEDTFLSVPLALRNSVVYLLDDSIIELLAVALLQPAEYGMMIMVTMTMRQISRIRSFRSEPLS